MKHTRKVFSGQSLKVIATAIGLSVIGLSLVGCEQKADPQIVEPVARPALTEVISASRSDSLVFNGVVRATERADLSFRVGGRLTELLVNEGERVVKGQLLARLDSRDAETVLASAKLELTNTEVEYQRAKAIYDKSKAISKSQLDEITTRYNLAMKRSVSWIIRISMRHLMALSDAVLLIISCKCKPIILFSRYTTLMTLKWLSTFQIV